MFLFVCEGVGVLLLTVSAVAWRLTANESGSSCRAMLGFARSASARGDGGAEPNRRFVPRLPPSYGRPHHPYAGVTSTHIHKPLFINVFNIFVT